MSADSVDLQGRPALILAFDPEVPPPALENAGAVVWVGRGHVPPSVAAEQVGWEALRALRVDPRLARVAARDAIVSTLRSASAVDILAAIRHGVRRFHVYQAPGAVFGSNARGMVRLALQRSLGRRLGGVDPLRAVVEGLFDVRLDPPWPTLVDTRRVTGEVLRRRLARPTRPRARGPLRIVHYVGGLGPGGAERQLTYVAAAARAAGHDVRVCTALSLEGDQAHYVDALRAGGVTVDWVPHAPFARGSRWGLPPDLTRRLESHVAWPLVAGITDALLRLRPDVLHCWLDVGNTVGALAGLIAEVPRIVLGTRALNPTHFAHLDLPWFRATYRWLSRCPDIVFLANSHAGAKDYAGWLGVRDERFRVIHNGVPLPARVPTADERIVERRALGLPEDAFVVAGVFRLSPEKRPYDFVRTLARARERIPRLRAVHVGTGALEDEVRRRAAESLGPTLTFAGRVTDPERWLRVADACVLTSAQEGCPNVSLEAQALGVPVVLTRAGGAPETVDEGRSGFLVDVGDVDALAERLAFLAGDPSRLAEMRERAREFVRERFSIDAMVRRTLETYID